MVATPSWARGEPPRAARSAGAGDANARAARPPRSPSPPTVETQLQALRRPRATRVIQSERPQPARCGRRSSTSSTHRRSAAYDPTGRRYNSGAALSGRGDTSSASFSRVRRPRHSAYTLNPRVARLGARRELYRARTARAGPGPSRASAGRSAPPACRSAARRTRQHPARPAARHRGRAPSSSGRDAACDVGAPSWVRRSGTRRRPPPPPPGPWRSPGAHPGGRRGTQGSCVIQASPPLPRAPSPSARPGFRSPPALPRCRPRRPAAAVVVGRHARQAVGRDRAGCPSPCQHGSNTIPPPTAPLPASTATELLREPDPPPPPSVRRARDTAQGGREDRPAESSDDEVAVERLAAQPARAAVARPRRRRCSGRWRPGSRRRRRRRRCPARARARSPLGYPSQPVPPAMVPLSSNVFGSCRGVPAMLHPWSRARCD